MLDVLEFYTDHQKREMEEMGFAGGLGPRTPSTTSGTTLVPSNYSTSTLSPYNEGPSTPRFNAGTGLGGAAGKTSLDRPQMLRQDSAPAGLNGADSTPAGLARAAELVNGSHAQFANTISASQTSGQGRSGLPQIGPGSLQPSRPAPPRPLLTANRPAPPAPKPPLPDHTPTSADLRARAKAQGPPTETQTAKPPGLGGEVAPVRKDSLAGEGDRLAARPALVPSKTSPANSLPMSHPAAGAAGSMVGPPPIKPLQPKKPIPANAPPPTPAVQVTDEDKSGSVAAAAAALEKPKVIEKRISTMNEVQIMEKLRSVVSDDDPKQLYSKIRKVGQG